MSWMNKDGLYVKFGREEGAAAVGGALNVDGRTRVVKATIDMTAVTDSDAIVGGADGSFGIRLPNAAFIEKVRVTVKTACTGSSSTLDIGLLKASDRSTALDADGLVAAATVASLGVAGNIIEYTQGDTSHGELIGTALAEEGVLCAKWGTAAFSAGEIEVEVFFS